MTTAEISTPSKSGFSKLRVVLWVLAVPLLGIVALVLSSLPELPALGASASGAEFERVKASPRFQNGKFVDVLPRGEMDTWRLTRAWFFEGSAYRTPTQAIPFQSRKGSEFAEGPKSGLRVTWLGHSTLLVEIEGKRVLFDPVFGERASPFWWTGVNRFFPPPLPLDELPAIDAVVISHDHYDHLDYPTVLDFAKRPVHFYVPLGVGAHLQSWGIPSERIHTFDWWDEVDVGHVRLVATPARHFSGRGLFDRETTLWAGWALIGRERRLFYSGDTALFPGFEEIGNRLGPFDIACLEAGAYSPLWADVHLGPEQAITAHRMLQGKVLLPVHWGMFDLALHGWTEPMERILVAAKKEGIAIATPRPGESVEPTLPLVTSRWWPEIPYDTFESAPVVSSGL